MKTRLIANPTSGGERALDLLQRLNDRLRPALDHLDIVLTTGDGDAARAARQAAGDGYAQVLAAGGDGTLNEVINGIAAAAADDPGQDAWTRLRVGLIPLGTGNDFAGTLGLPDDPEAAAEVVLRGETRQIDLGVMNDRRFINASAGGFIAETSANVDSRLKSIAGAFAYVLGGVRTLIEWEPVQTTVTLDDDAPFTLDMQMFVVANGQTIGGGNRVAPDARLDDGRMDVCLVHAMPNVAFVPLLGRIAAGEHVGDDGVVMRQAKRARFAFSRPIKVNVDGQVLDAADATYEVEPGRVRFIAPR